MAPKAPDAAERSVAASIDILLDYSGPLICGSLAIYSLDCDNNGTLVPLLDSLIGFVVY